MKVRVEVKEGSKYEKEKKIPNAMLEVEISHAKEDQWAAQNTLKPVRKDS